MRSKEVDTLLQQMKILIVILGIWICLNVGQYFANLPVCVFC